MENETLALIASFIAMALIMCSYFFKKKELYLLFQALGMVFLITNYFFSVQFFAMIGLGFGLFRALVFFVYEKRNQNAPIFWPFLFSGPSLAAYFIVNWDNLQWLDVMFMAALILYAFIFRIRDLKLVRFTVLAPTSLSLLYNILIEATPFAVLSYAFELGANLVAIVKYDVFGKDKTQQKKNNKECKEQANEEN